MKPTHVLPKFGSTAKMKDEALSDHVVGWIFSESFWIRVGLLSRPRLSVRTFGTPSLCCPAGTPGGSSAIWRCSGSGRRGCTCPRRRCTPLKWPRPGWPGTRCTGPWCGSGRWRNCRPQCPKPTTQPRSTSSPQISSFLLLRCLRKREPRDHGRLPSCGNSTLFNLNCSLNNRSLRIRFAIFFSLLLEFWSSANIPWPWTYTPIWVLHAVRGHLSHNRTC